MAQDPSFVELMARLRAGDEEAARLVFGQFARRLAALARRRLDARLRAKVDPEDVLQSVYRSFFRRHVEGQFEVASWDDLWSLLTVLTLRRCGHWHEHFRAARRDVAREQAPAPAADGSDDSWQVLARGPSASHAAMLTEALEELLRGLGERDRAIVTLALQRYTPAEISAELRRPLRTVYRVLERVKRQLRQDPTGAAGGS